MATTSKGFRYPVSTDTTNVPRDIGYLASDVDNWITNNPITINGTPVTLGGTVSITGLPTQTGNNGKYLTTDGSTASWATIDLSSYLTTTSASSTYLTITNAASTYLTTTNASTTYAAKASPTFTGTPLAPTATAGTNTTQIATTAFVSTAVSNLVNSAPSTLDTLNELAAALGNDASFSTTVTNSIAGKVSKSGGDTITTSSASVIGLIIKGAASQTAALQDWQLSDGTSLLKLTTTSLAQGLGAGAATSGFILLSGAYSGFGSAEWYVRRDGGNLAISSPAGVSISQTYDAVSLTVNARSGQTYDLQQWKNSSGATLAKIDKDGILYYPGNTSLYDYVYTTDGSTDLNWKKVVDITAPVGLYTGTSFEIEVIDSNDNYGVLTTTPYLLKYYVKITRSTGVQDDTNTAVVLGPSTDYVRVVKNSASSYELQFRQSNVYKVHTFKIKKLTNNAMTNINYPVSWGSLTNGSTTGTVITADNSGSNARFFETKLSRVITNSLHVEPINGDNVLTTIKAAAGQTANILEWRNSANAVLGFINSAGFLKSNYVYSSAIVDTADNGSYIALNANGVNSSAVQILNRSASQVPLAIKGYVSQTANLQEWQDSSGTVKALVGSGGNGVFNGLRSGSGSTTGAINAYTTAAQIGILVQGAASQTANLQEWSDSTGVYTASMDQYAQFKAVKLTTSNYITGVTSTSANIQFNAGYGIVIKSDAAGYMPLVVRGSTSQTADLFSAQTSTGTILARITPSGGFELSGKDIELMTIMGAF